MGIPIDVDRDHRPRGVNPMITVRNRLGSLAVVMLGLAGGPAAELPAILAADPPLRVGLAKVDISPETPVCLNGFGGRTGESQGVRQPIVASAIAVAGPEGNDDTVIVITVETLGIPDALAERIATRLAAHGISRSRLALCATHTHSAPMIPGCANTLFGAPIPPDRWARILAYGASLEAKLEQVALMALADRRPATLTHATGRLGFAFNRRTPGGPVDHDLPVLVVQEPDGRLRGLFSTYACHCVTLADSMVSGDWAGYAVHHLQRRHPGCQAMISIGCGADANPRGGVVGGAWEVADLLGREMADEIDRLLESPREPITSPPRATFDRIPLPLAPLPDRAGWVERSRQEGAIGHHARAQLERIDRGERPATEISYPVQTVTFGDTLAWVFLPGEVVVDYGIRLKRELDGERVWIHAYANACPGYVPSERILAEGGYEGGQAMVYYDVPGPYATGIEDRIVATVRRHLDDRFLAPSDASRTGGIRPLSPRRALASLRVAPGFAVELVAAEPMVESPVAVTFGPDGRIWVAEMADYPSGVPDGSPGGRIRCLEDLDGDGFPDRATVFMEGIPFPTGITPWRDGVLICAAPDILFVADTDGDGRADRSESLFSGFATHNFQARVNSLEYALEGGLEGACGLFGGEIRSGRNGTTTPLGGRDFRIDPDSGSIDAAAGSSQQGRVRNDAGDWFGCNNSTFAIHFPLADDWLRRNPAATARRTAMPIDSAPGPGQLFPLSTQVLFELSGPVGRATAACGLGVYRDELLGTAAAGPFTGDLFTCEPVNNLVHHQRLARTGATFNGERVAGEERQEFLASTDPWFRPVQVRTGPDGALWVVDMYRYVIEHPIWIPEETLARLDPRAGADRGRIYRVVPRDRPLREVPRIDTYPTADLPAALESPNGTVRDLVQKQIEWRGDRSIVPPLERLATESPRSAVRVQALATLANLGAVPKSLLLRALADIDADVRRRAVRIVHTLGAARDDEALAAATAALAEDPSAPVRLEVAAAAATLPPPIAARTLVKLADSDGQDDFFAVAIASSLSADIAAAVATSIEARWADGGGQSPPFDDLTEAAATRADATVFGELLTSARRAAASEPTVPRLERLCRIVEAGRRRPADIPLAATASDEWNGLLRRCQEWLADPAAAPPLRIVAARLLGHGTFIGIPSTDALHGALGPQTAPAVRSAALAALRSDGREEVAGGIIAAWPTLAPAARREAVGLLVERPTWAETLLEAVRAGIVGRADLDLPTRQALLEAPDPVLRALAATVLDAAPAGERQDTIRRYAAAIDRHGNAETGGPIFDRTCAACHRVGDRGHPIGPDIASYAGKPVEALLESLFDPHRAVDPRYEAYVVALDDGRSLTGAIADETPSSLVVLGAGGKRDAVMRTSIVDLRGTGRSLMPEGYERELTPADVNDLWAWLAVQRPAAKVLAGNTPTVTVVDGSAPMVLPARSAEIRGGDIVFEAEFGNVGHWHSIDDSVRWAVQVADEGTFDLWGEWACAPGSAGNRMRIDGVNPSIVATVGSTGGWDRYSLVPLGTVTLPAGGGGIVIRADEPLRGALVDLRAIHLVAVGDTPTAMGTVDHSRGAPPPDATAPATEIATWLLDSRLDDAGRQRVIDALASATPAGTPTTDPAEVIRALVSGLPDAPRPPEEYRRIPTVWQVAVAVGRHGDRERWRRVLAASLPGGGERLRDWQAVVIGGGLINGAGLAGHWPDDDVTAALADDAALQSRWKRLLDQAARMADDGEVPEGTRYDALRIVALDSPAVAVPLLTRYLAPGTSEELRMGAVSGLADIDEDVAVSALVSALPTLAGTNLELAIAALVRTPERSLAILRAIDAGFAPPALRSHERISALVDHASPQVSTEARKVLGDERGGVP